LYEYDRNRRNGMHAGRQIFLHHQIATVQASTNTGGAAKRSLQ
jgi:hypothetical protein